MPRIASVALIFVLAGPARGGDSQERLVTLRNAGLAVSVVVNENESDPVARSRFDRAGRVQSLQYNGREYLGSRGMPDDFGILGVGVLGFNEADIGGNFLKIGVGTLVKSGGNFYRFMKGYEVKRFAANQMEGESADRLTIVQESDIVRGYGYRYEKTYLVKENATLEIHYKLSNAGSTAFTFDQFNHNWFALGGGNPDEAMSVAMESTEDELGASWLRKDGDRLRLAGEISDSPGYTVALVAKAGGRFPQKLDILNERSGLGVTLQTSFRPARVVLFIDQEGMCPEIFFLARLNPGESVEWRRIFIVR